MVVTVQVSLSPPPQMMLAGAKPPPWASAATMDRVLSPESRRITLASTRKLILLARMKRRVSSAQLRGESCAAKEEDSGSSKVTDL